MFMRWPHPITFAPKRRAPRQPDGARQSGHPSAWRGLLWAGVQFVGIFVEVPLPVNPAGPDLHGKHPAHLAEFAHGPA